MPPALDLMDPLKFKTLTEHLLKYNAKLERDVLIKNTEPKLCTYCDKSVVNQRITCEAYRLGTEQEHFKHKCQTCKMFVYDGSSPTPYAVKRPTHTLYYKPANKAEPTLSIYGKRMGRPPKPKQDMPKRARGRPRKNPTL